MGWYDGTRTRDRAQPARRSEIDGAAIDEREAAGRGAGGVIIEVETPTAAAAADKVVSLAERLRTLERNYHDEAGPTYIGPADPSALNAESQAIAAPANGPERTGSNAEAAPPRPAADTTVEIIRDDLAQIVQALAARRAAPNGKSRAPETPVTPNRAEAPLEAADAAAAKAVVDRPPERPRAQAAEAAANPAPLKTEPNRSTPAAAVDEALRTREAAKSPQSLRTGKSSSTPANAPSPKAAAPEHGGAEVRGKALSPSPGIVEPLQIRKFDAPVAEKAMPGGPGGGGPGKTSGGGGNGGGGSPSPLQQRKPDQEFRDVLGKGLAGCRRNLVTVAIFSFWVNCFVLAVPIYLFQVSDRVLTSRSTDTLIMLTIVVIGALVVHVFLDMMRRFILMRIAVDAESKLGAPVLSAAAKASQSGSSREYQTLGDLQQLRAFLTGPVILTMLDAPVAPVYLLVVFLINPDLGWIVSTTGLMLLIVALINQKLTAVPFSVANAYSIRANLQAEAMSRNAQVINAMGMIPEGVVMWGRETAASLKAQVTAQDRNILMTAITKFIRLSTQIAILGWGAWLALEGHLTGGMVIAASIVASRALAPVEGTIEGWRNFIHARAAYARIKALIQSSPLNTDRLRLPRPMGRLSVERLLYVPPPSKRVILNGISFQLEPGESLAIVGASGTGKSTLARMLVGSIAPTAGNVRLDRMELRNWDSRQFGENVGYLPQDVQLFPGTIKANIARMREDATDAAIFDAAEVADVHEMISHFSQGYETIVSMDGSPLSGGQRQRIGLARAFFGDPRLVVLDEPNSNLDTPGEQALARALVRAKEKGITVVAVTQRPTLLKSVDKIMILRDGAVQAIGKRDDILPVLAGPKPGGGTSQPSGAGAPLADS
jgi:ATP-binding cassette subfamily C protein